MELYFSEQRKMKSEGLRYRLSAIISKGILSLLCTATLAGCTQAAETQINETTTVTAATTATTTVTTTVTATEAVIKFGDQAMASVQVLPLVAGTQMEFAFTHIFSGGYAAGYYSYKWSELLDADAYSVFKAAKAKTGTIFDKKAADLFRKNILERGGTAKPMELYRAFRGGEPSIDALLERDGITKK